MGAARSLDQTEFRPSDIKRISQIDVKHKTHMQSVVVNTDDGRSGIASVAVLITCFVWETHVDFRLIKNNYLIKRSKLGMYEKIKRVNNLMSSYL